VAGGIRPVTVAAWILDPNIAAESTHLTAADLPHTSESHTGSTMMRKWRNE
jgi:hypothetical protein